jgi:hypothetical protein
VRVNVRSAVSESKSVVNYSPSAASVAGVVGDVLVEHVENKRVERMKAQAARSGGDS